jgi:hypothetical protein
MTRPSTHATLGTGSSPAPWARRTRARNLEHRTTLPGATFISHTWHIAQTINERLCSHLFPLRPGAPSRLSDPPIAEGHSGHVRIGQSTATTGACPAVTLREPAHES